MYQQKISVEDLCMKLKPILGKKMDEIYFRYSMANSPEERLEIEHLLNMLYNKYLYELLNKEVILEPPAKQDVEGEYPLAVVSYANKQLFPFAIRERDWIRHVCISGMSGSGKTTLAFNIISNFIEKQKPFIVFDWKKSFRPLTTLDNEILCFTVGNENISNLFKININTPPKNVQPREWINVLCDLITESFLASYGVHKILLETLDEAFRDAGVYSGSNNYPTWFEIKRRLEDKEKKVNGREASWLISAMRIAHVLTFGDFGKVMNYKGKDALTIQELMNKKVIFELNSLGNVEKKFFCEMLLTYIYKLKKANQLGIKESFEQAIIVDEAHNIFLKDKTHFVNESVTDMVYREMREYGTALICLDQHVSKISDTVAGNSACHIAFQQQLPQDIECISSLMQLRDKRHYFSMLPVGTAIVKIAERYSFPFLVQVPKAELKGQIVSDKDIKERMRAIATWKQIQVTDKEFSQELMQENPGITQIQEVKGNLDTIIKLQPEIKQEQKSKEKILTPDQKVLYDFVIAKLQVGEHIEDIQHMIKKFVERYGYYTQEDISSVINYALDKDIRITADFVTTKEKGKAYKDEKSIILNTDSIGVDIDGEKFITFLADNRNKDLSTTEIYDALNLAARKGNKIKNQLLSKGLIKIHEEKNSKGWKKIIKLI